MPNKKATTKTTTKESTTEKDTKPAKTTNKEKTIEIKVSKVNFIRTVGRRKTAVARVRLFKDGKGKITVNDKDWKIYFPTVEQQHAVFSPIKITGQANKIDFTIKVVGGGLNSQSGAVRHGVARALLKFDADFKASLKKGGFLTRDSRKKERKKPGLKRARRAPQWKKR